MFKLFSYIRNVLCKEMGTKKYYGSNVKAIG